MDLINLQGGGDRLTSSQHDRDRAADGGGGDDASNADTAVDNESATTATAMGPNRLLKVLKAFEALKSEFDEKFRKMWA